MGRGRRHEFETAVVPQSAKDGEQIAVPIKKALAAPAKMLVIKFGQKAQAFVVTIANNFALGQGYGAIEIPDVAFAQQLVLQHRAERRRHRHRELERHFVSDEPLHHREERDVAFRYRLEEPVFLEEFLMFRVPDKRQVRVKDEREVTGRHREFGIFNPRSPFRTPNSLERPTEILEAVEALFDHVDARRVTKTNGAIIAK